MRCWGLSVLYLRGCYGVCGRRECVMCHATSNYLGVLCSSLLLCYCSIGKGVEQLLERPDGKYCFRLHEDRVYYVRCAAQGHGVG